MRQHGLTVMVWIWVAGCGAGTPGAKPGVQRREFVVQKASGCPNAAACGEMCTRGDAAACHKYGERELEAGQHLYAREAFGKACRLGHAKGCTRLGQLLDDEDSPIHDNDGAYDAYVEGCTLQDGEACENAGWAHKLADGAPADERGAARFHKRAAELYELACEASSADDCSRLGELARTGVAVAQDEARAITLYERACKLGSGAGCRNLARHGSAASAIDVACDDKGSVEGCVELALRYEHGQGVDADPARAAAYFRKGCEAGSLRACDYEGYLHEHGLGVTQDYAVAVERYASACKSGFVLGCYDLGRMHQHGLGIVQSDDMAVKLFSQTCESDEKIGCGSLAYMYQHGRGALKSTQDALRLYELSCRANEPDGCHGLGLMLELNDKGITPDYNRAVALHLDACDKGFAPACEHMGDVLRVGDLAKQDLERALQFYGRACDLKLESACKQHARMIGGPPIPDR